MASTVVYSGGVTHSVQVYCQVSQRSIGNRKFCGGRLELGRGRVRPRATEVKVSYDGRGRHVEVIGVGSRRDAVLDFCLESPYKSPALRLVSGRPLSKNRQNCSCSRGFLRKILLQTLCCSLLRRL